MQSSRYTSCSVDIWLETVGVFEDVMHLAGNKDADSTRTQIINLRQQTFRKVYHVCYVTLTFSGFCSSDK